MARLRLWLVMLPLVAAGTQGAAALVDAFAPRSYKTVELFARSNGSHALLPLAIALGAVVLLYALCSLAISTPGPRRLHGWAFACLPPLVFTVQEHVEYVLGHGHLPSTLVTNPIFLAGLLLQIPFAVAAYLVARALVTVAVAIAERASGSAPPARRQAARPLRPGRDVPALTRLGGGSRLTRGPPPPLTA
jgi:hypothetical protein